VARTALITGASAGLGAEFARKLAERGYALALVARRADRLNEVTTELSNRYDVSVSAIVADLAKPTAPEHIFRQLDGVEVSFLVNNAGSAGPDLLAERDWMKQAAFLQLMMTSVAHLCHLFIPPMVERGFGRVVNVSSMAARLIMPGDTNYGPVKEYMVALSEGLAGGLKGTGVRVSALCPGFTHTEFHEAADMLEFKRGIPDFLWYDAETVVREGLDALERGKAVYCSGRVYRAMDALAQFGPARWLLKKTVLDRVAAQRAAARGA
jgi:short-subunit dehydrogenase